MLAYQHDDGIRCRASTPPERLFGMTSSLKLTRHIAHSKQPKLAALQVMVRPKSAAEWVVKAARVENFEPAAAKLLDGKLYTAAVFLMQRRTPSDLYAPSDRQPVLAPVGYRLSQPSDSSPVTRCPCQPLAKCPLEGNLSSRGYAAMFVKRKQKTIPRLVYDMGNTSPQHTEAPAKSKP